MKITRGFLVLIFGMSIPVATLHAQVEQARIDSSFRVYMNEAFDELDTNYSDSLQNKYASEFFNYYLNHPNSDVAKDALAYAFVYWGNTGADDMAERAMSKIDYDSQDWALFIHYVGNIFYKSDNKSLDDYFELLQSLRKRLSHPRSKSAVLLAMADYYFSKRNFDKIEELSRKIIEIDADEFFVAKARGYLYEATSIQIGDMAPEVEATTIQGDTISLSDFRGNYVLLEFWATWCGPCLPDIPYLKSIYSTYSLDELQIIGISQDRDKKVLKNFIEERDMKWPQIIQSDQSEADISKLYNVFAIPRSYVINPQGIIVAKDLRGKELEEKITQLIKE